MSPADLSPAGQARFDRLGKRWADEDALSVACAGIRPNTWVRIVITSCALWFAAIETGCVIAGWFL